MTAVMDAHKKQSNIRPNIMKQFWTLLIRRQKIIPITDYTGTIGSNGASLDLMQQQGIQSSAQYHQDISTLLYKDFIQIMLTNNTALLVISGSPTEWELQAAWQAILFEFVDITNNEKSSTIHVAWQAMLFTECKIKFVDWALYALKYRYSEEIATALVEQGFDFVQETEDREAYIKQLELIETDAKFLVVRLNQLSNEYQLLTGGEGEQPRTIGDYEKELAILSKFMQQRIDKSKITTLEFAAIVNLYNEYNKTQTNGPEV